MNVDTTITEQNTEGVLEIILTDLNGKEHIYWVDITSCTDADDTTDWAISRAKALHLKLGLDAIPEDEFTDDDELQSYALASMPFSRQPSEYTFIASD